MERDEIYETWAPSGAPWSDWAKPVLFAFLPDEPGDGIAAPSVRIAAEAIVPADEHDEPSPYRMAPLRAHDTAVVVDLPGVESVAAGLALAHIGFRPVPLFNAPPGGARPASLRDNVSAVVDVLPIIAALVAGAEELRACRLAEAAPPAFLLDANRASGRVRAQAFDNRSVSAWTDFPSADRLIQSSIRRAVLLQRTSRQAQWDLAATLGRWQQGGLQMFVQTLPVDSTPVPIRLLAPSWLGRARDWIRRSKLQPSRSGFDFGRGFGSSG